MNEVDEIRQTASQTRTYFKVRHYVTLHRIRVGCFYDMNILIDGIFELLGHRLLFDARNPLFGHRIKMFSDLKRVVAFPFGLRCPSVIKAIA